MKPKRCRICKTEFTPRLPLQKVCGLDCAKSLAVSDRVKAEKRAEVRARKDTRAKLEAMKSIPELMAEADKAFCAYIRARDAGQPCICCGKHSSGWTRGGEHDGGHYRSRGAASHLRYDERNCHLQLKRCNRRGFDVASYRANLVRKIGLAAVEALENDNRTHKWTRDELRAIRDEYRAKLKEFDR